MSNSDSSEDSQNGFEHRSVESDEKKSESNSEAQVSKPKISLSMKKPMQSAKKPSGPAIQIKFNAQKTPTSSQPVLKRPSSSVAAVFGDFSDEEPEDMPPEAKMRMRNRGRNTPTSAGPNSFGKTKYGFINSKKVFEKNLKQAALELCDEEKQRKKI